MMNQLVALLPSTERGYLPLFLLAAAVASFGNAAQNLSTLHYTRRIYNGLFVRNTSLPPVSTSFNPEDSLEKWRPASSTGREAEKATDQVTPLAARLFGTYTFAVGLIRLYACYRIDDPRLYQLAIWTHVIAALHFTSEWLAYKTIKFTGAQAFPFLAAYGGGMWMISQWVHYVQ